MPVRRILASLALVPVLGLLAGCGSDQAPAVASSAAAANGLEKLPDAEVLERMKQASRNASSVRVRGTLPGAGRRLELDLRLQARSGATGTVTEGGRSVDVMVIGNDLYVRGDGPLLDSIGGPSASDRLAGRWLRSRTVSADPGGLGEMTSVQRFLDGLTRDLAADRVKRGPRRETGGTPALTYVGADDKGGTIYVALRGKPYLLRYEPGPGADQAGRIEFGEYDRPVEPAVPPAADRVVDADHLRPGRVR